MDTYFATYPEYVQFRRSLLTGHKQLAVILGDWIATGEFVKDFDAESTDEDSNDSVITLEEEEEDQDVHDSVERSRKSSSSRSASNSRSLSVVSSRSSLVVPLVTEEKKKSVATQSFRKQLAKKAVKWKGEREKKSNKLFRGVAEFEGESTRVMTLMMERSKAASRGAILEAIEWVDMHIAVKYLEREIFRIYDLLQDEAKAAALTVMAEERRAGQIEYELEKLEAQETCQLLP